MIRMVYIVFQMYSEFFSFFIFSGYRKRRLIWRDYICNWSSFILVDLERERLSSGREGKKKKYILAEFLSKVCLGIGMMNSQVWRWVLGLLYILLVATIWIAASFVVQSVVDQGVSPFLVTYICNSLFMVYIPLVEIGRYLEDKHKSLLFWCKREATTLQDSRALEKAILLDNDEADVEAKILNPDLVAQQEIVDHLEGEVILGQDVVPKDVSTAGLDAKGRWTRQRVAKVSLLICPIWFLAQLTFNLSLKYTTVTSNTILSSSSSLFTFLVALVFLGEKFTWLKLTSVLLCMGGTIIVSLGDSGTESSVVASNPVLGDILALLSSAFYAVYITLIRQRLPDEDDEVQGHVSMAQFLGFLGLFNFLLFLPIALILEFMKLESIYSLTGKEFGLIVGKGMIAKLQLLLKDIDLL